MRKFVLLAENITSQKWTQLPQMKEKMYSCAAIVVGNTTYIVGGKDSSGHLSSCEVFDFSINTWSYPIIPDMNRVRGGCQVVTMGPNKFTSWVMDY